MRLRAWTGNALARLRDVLRWAYARLYEVPLREVLEGAWLRAGAAAAHGERELETALVWFDLLERLGEGAYDRATVMFALTQLYAAPKPGAANTSKS